MSHYDAWKTTDAHGAAADALYESLIARHEAAIADVVDRLDDVRRAFDESEIFDPPDCVTWALDDLCSTFGVVNPRKPRKKGDGKRDF